MVYFLEVAFDLYDLPALVSFGRWAVISVLNFQLFFEFLSIFFDNHRIFSHANQLYFGLKVVSCLILFQDIETVIVLSRIDCLDPADVIFSRSVNLVCIVLGVVADYNMDYIRIYLRKVDWLLPPRRTILLLLRSSALCLDFAIGRSAILSHLSVTKLYL